MKPVRTAIIPVAGRGTRFLPASKATPKVLLPILDRPLIQYAVDEALESGIETIVIVTGKGQSAIEDYFGKDHELESALSKSGKDDILTSLESLRPSAGQLVFVRQNQPLGLGHAIWCARHVVGDEAFAVILPDEVMFGDEPALRTLIDSYNDLGTSVVLVDEVDPERTDSYGIVDPSDGERGERPFAVRDVVEKPAPDKAPTTLAVVGRYVLRPEVMRALGSTHAGAGGEIQLTDAIRATIASAGLHAVRNHTSRFDCGSKEGFLEATVMSSMEDPDLRAKMIELARRIVSDRE